MDHKQNQSNNGKEGNNGKGNGKRNGNDIGNKDNNTITKKIQYIKIFMVKILLW